MDDEEYDDETFEDPSHEEVNNQIEETENDAEEEGLEEEGTRRESHSPTWSEQSETTKTMFNNMKEKLLEGLKQKNIQAAVEKVIGRDIFMKLDE